MKNTKNETVRLSPDEKEKLNTIALSMRSLSRHGATAGKPSWRILLKDIAFGRVGVVDRLKRKGDGK